MLGFMHILAQIKSLLLLLCCPCTPRGRGPYLSKSEFRAQRQNSPHSLPTATKTFHKQRQTIRGQCKGSQNQCKGWRNVVSLKRRNGCALQGGATASPCSAFSLGKSVARIRSIIILSTYLQNLESSIKGSTKLGPVKISGGHSLR